MALGAAACASTQTSSTPTLDTTATTTVSTATPASEAPATTTPPTSAPSSTSTTEPTINLFPDIDVLNIADGATLNLASELGGGDAATLLWFFAPH